MVSWSFGEALSVGLLLLSWGLIWFIRSDLSQQEFWLGVIVLVLITIGFLVGRIFEWRAR